jgi:hypothetical protein
VLIKLRFLVSNGEVVKGKNGIDVGAVAVDNLHGKIKKRFVKLKYYPKKEPTFEGSLS